MGDSAHGWIGGYAQPSAWSTRRCGPREDDRAGFPVLGVEGAVARSLGLGAGAQCVRYIAARLSSLRLSKTISLRTRSLGAWSARRWRRVWASW